MPVVRPFSALRYDSAVAGPLAGLVAPPYDVIDAEARLEYLARSPYNVVHLTLPDTPEQAGEELARWRAEGALGRRPLSGGSRRTTAGRTGSSAARGIRGGGRGTPYAARQVLPHGARHAGPKEGRLRLLRRRTRSWSRSSCSTTPNRPLERPDRRPDWMSRTAEFARVWRLPARSCARRAAADRRRPPPLRDGGRVPGGAAGGDPYASPCSSPRARPGSRSSRRTGVVRAVGRGSGRRGGPPTASVDSLPRRQVRAGRRRRRFGAACRRVGSRRRCVLHAVRGGGDRRGRRGGRGRVPARPDRRPGGGFAERGEMMPQKSTFFYPKLTSGLLLYPAMSDGSTFVARARDVRPCSRELPRRDEREPLVGAGGRRRHRGDRRGGRARDARQAATATT